MLRLPNGQFLPLAKREKRSVTSYIEVMLGKLWEERAGQNKR